MKKLLSALTLSLLIAGCGGGGGSDYSTNLTTSELTTAEPTTATTSEETAQKTVVATVEASLVKGATVCVKDTSACAETDDGGKAQLPVTTLPVSLEVKVGSLKLGELTVSSDVARLNPMLLAKGDLPAALALAGVLHGAAGDKEGTAEKIDLSGVKIVPEGEVSGSLVDALKEQKELKLKVEKGNQVREVEVKVSDDGSVEVKVDGEEVKPVSNEVKLLLWKVSTFLTAADGKAIKLKTPKGEVVTCSLEVNPTDPNQFKLQKCTNPEFNDEGYETVAVEDGKVVVKDEDGEKFLVEDVSVASFTVVLKNEEGEEELVWLAGIPSVVPELTTEEAKEKLLQGKFDLVYSSLGAKDERTDEEKVLFALAVLGKAAKDDLLAPLGMAVVTLAEDAFEVREVGDREVKLADLQAGAKDFLGEVEEALNELEKVKDPTRVKVNANGFSLTLDGPSLKTIQALLLYARSNLEYLLAYDWSALEEPVRKGALPLEFMTYLKLSDSSYLENSRSDLKKALSTLASAGEELLNLSCDNSSTVSCELLKGEGEEEALSREDVGKLVDGIKALSGAPDGKVDFQFVSLKTGKINDYHLNLAPLFDQPLTGEEVKRDAENKDLIQVKICTNYYWDGEKKNCYGFDYDVLFTKDSSIYERLKASEWEYFESNLKAVEGTLFGKNYYSLFGYDISTDDVVEVVYPKE